MKFKINIRPKNLKLKDLKIGKKERKYNKEIVFILIIIVILIVFFSGVAMGKAIHNSSIASNTEIAKPILEVEKDSEIIITEANNQGEYNFKVKNYNNLDEISQVDLKYYIEILNDNLDKSIKYSLYRENEEIELTENKTEEITLKKDLKQEQIYTLKVQYDSNQNNIGDIIKEIQIKVHSEQLKI